MLRQPGKAELSGGSALRCLLLLAIGGLGACGGRELSRQQVAPLAATALESQSRIYWIEGFDNSNSASPLCNLLPASAAVVTHLIELLQPAATQPVVLSIAGADSAYAARVVRLALENTAGDLPHLRLLFIGQPRDAEGIGKMVAARKGHFLFSPAPVAPAH